MPTRTEELDRVISTARALAASRGARSHRTEHLLEAIVTDPKSRAYTHLRSMGGEPEWFLKTLRIVRLEDGPEARRYGVQALESDEGVCRPRDTVELLENFPVGSIAERVLTIFGYYEHRDLDARVPGGSYLV